MGNGNSKFSISGVRPSVFTVKRSAQALLQNAIKSTKAISAITSSTPMPMNMAIHHTWIDGVLEDKANIAQKDNVRAMIFWGHAPNSQTRGIEMKKAMENYPV